MKNSRLLLLVCLFVFVSIKVKAQIPSGYVQNPATQSVCKDEIKDYYISGSIGSTFTWEIVAPGGAANIILPASGNGPVFGVNLDHIQIIWGTDGVFTLQVTETTNSIPACSVTRTMVINVNPNITPTFAALGPYCLGASPGVLPTTSTNLYTGTWNPAIISTTLVGNLTYTFTPTAGQCATTAIMSITINPLPIATATNNGPICANTTLSLTGGTNGMTTYNWSGPNTYANTTQSPVVSALATPSMSGIYTLTISDGTCTNSASTNVTVNPLPTAIAANNGPICANTSLSLTGGANGMTSYSWSGPNTFANNTQSPVVSAIATPAMSGTYTLTISDGTCTNSASTNVNVNPLPTATATNNGPICANTTLSLTGGANGMTSYNWSGPNTFSNNTQSPVVSTNATPAMSGTYTLTISDGTCTNSASTNVTVNPLPIATASNNGPICEGATLSLLGGTNGMTSYNWTGPNTYANATQSPVVSTNATLSMSGTYTLTISNGTCTNTASTNVTINPLPNPSGIWHNP